ncbi:MAG: alpha/beta hydrolase [Actinomycetota bacterium]|nr:alpha/beta hydrolase [Actinomycetota bacterium]
MSRRKSIALVGTAAGLAAGIVAERVAVKRRRTRDPEADEDFGSRRGARSRLLELEDGAKLFIEETGPETSSGVVFVHGSALRTDLWHYQMDAFEGRRAIFFDMRGHGRSQPLGEAEYSMKTLADDLGAVIDACGLDEVVVVGHSVGGMVALQMARDRSDLLGSKIKAITLVNTTYRPPVETVAGGAAIAHFERAMRRPFEMLGSHSARIDRLRKVIRPSDALFWTVSFSAFGPQASAKQVDFTYDMVAETPSETIFSLFKAYRGFDVTDHLGDVTVPTLIIAGGHDRICLAEASEHMASELPKAQLEMFDECGHMTMLEAHERFNLVLSDFLADTLGPVTSK